VGLEDLRIGVAARDTTGIGIDPQRGDLLAVQVPLLHLLVGEFHANPPVGVGLGVDRPL